MSKVVITRKGRGIHINASGSAAQALFAALTQPAPSKAPSPEPAPAQPVKPDPQKIQIGPLDV